MIKPLEKLLDLIYPRRCPVCDGILSRGEKYFCKACCRDLSSVSEPYCMKCGKMLSAQENEYCGDCIIHAHNYDRGRSLLLYDEAIKKSLYRFKYSARKEYAESYAWLAEEKLGAFIREINPDVLIPVPLHRRRRQKRGYNQAELFARALGRRMGIPVEANLVKRVKNTVPQKELDLAARQNNLKKAFKIRGNDVKLYTTIIIDDIYTTGSTIDALSEALREAGAGKIYFLTIAGGR